MSLQAVENKRLYQQVAEQIAALIRSGEWAAGSRLPSERTMSQQLGVSRPTVREAVLFLEIIGLVEVRTGAGIYVLEEGQRGERSYVGEDFGPSPYYIIDTRLFIESEIAAQVAGTITEEQLVGLRDAIKKMEEDAVLGRQDATNERDGDRLFHNRLAGAIGNPVLESIVDQLWEGMRRPMFKTVSKRVQLPKNALQAVADHRAIVASLEQRDADGARLAMRRHLEQVKALFFDETEGNENNQ